MKPNRRARVAAAITLSKGKMYEYGIPVEDHLELPSTIELDDQFPFAIGTLGDFAAQFILDGTTPKSKNQQDELIFAAQIFHAYDESKLELSRSSDLRLLAAAGFYLAEMPGSSHVQLRRLTKSGENDLDPISAAISAALDKPWEASELSEGRSREEDLLEALRRHFQSGSKIGLSKAIQSMRRWAYEDGSNRELLLADVLSAVALARVNNSCWSLLPDFSGLPKEAWAPYLIRSTAIKEMWPSQRMLGEAGLYRGNSGVVQMPTSAGKTRATQLIIRAAFLSGRAKLTVVVAPFRALCQEIATDLRSAFEEDDYFVNQLSDALQPDFKHQLQEILDRDVTQGNHVIVLTPEKFLYVLRQDPNFVDNLGLIIYDEGHQFDTGVRGVTYELLLTSIKRLLPARTQTVLISAVIENASQVSRWLVSDENRVVSNTGLQTRRLIAFASLPKGRDGQLQFNPEVGDGQEFYVPRVVISEKLPRFPRERKDRFFPTEESGSIALYLALRLAGNGGVAIYVRTKLSAAKLVRDAVEVFHRGPSLQSPATYSDQHELDRLTALFRANFGDDSYLTKAAVLGLFAHHGNTPHGLRLAIEHAMRKDKIRVVICTSTLAQGVNLPLRYLLVTSPMQGNEAIKPRDFHNLMGRAGRAGIHGEGTVIFTDPRLYDEKESNRKRWNSALELLQPGKTKPTGSSLLELLAPLRNEYGTDTVSSPTALEVVESIISGSNSLDWIDHLNSNLIQNGFTSNGLRKQIEIKRATIEAIESYLMTNRGESASTIFILEARALARETFAYSLANDVEKLTLEFVFQQIAKRIEDRVPDSSVQIRYGRSLLGVSDSLEVDEWVLDHVASLSFVVSPEDLFRIVTPLLLSMSRDKILKEVAACGAFSILALGWINGDSYGELLGSLNDADVMYAHGAHRRRLDSEVVVELCEQALGFDFSLILAAVKESYGSLEESEENGEAFDRHIDLLQKRLKYGLPTKESIQCFELGFSERVVA